MVKTDKEIIEEFISNPSVAQLAFEELVNRYKNYVFKICYSKLNNIEDAEDATQEIFVRAYFGLNKFRFDSEFKTWITKISFNVCMTMVLSNKRKFWRTFISTDGDSDLDLIYRSTFTQGQESSFWNVVGETLYKMIQGYRKVFIFKYFKNIDIAGISKKIASTLGATKMKLKRAKDQFIKILLDNQNE